MLTPVPILAAGGGSIVLAILGIGFLIFVHEFGHYMACRLTKTRVETFSIGFGTRLFGWERLPGQPRRFTLGRRRLDPSQHAMDFRVALVPLGGYVKMAGELIGEARTGSPDEFSSKGTWARVFIISAGVIMNVITAAVLYFVAFAGEVPQEPAMVGHVESGGAAWEAGIRPGDRIVELGGARTRSFTGLRMETVFLDPDETADVVVDRAGERITLRVQPRYSESAGMVQLGVGPVLDLRILDGETEIDVGYDELVELDGIPVRGGAALQVALAGALGAGRATVELRKADGSTHRLHWSAAEGEPTGSPVYKVGIELATPLVVKHVRGTAVGALLPDDVLIAADARGGRRTLRSVSDRLRLVHEAPITMLEVERGSEVVRVPVALDTPSAASAFFSDVSLAADLAAWGIQPIHVGTISVVGDAYYRYASAPSREAGLDGLARLTALDGHAVGSFQDAVKLIQGKGSQLLDLRIAVGDESRTLTVRPAALERLDGPTLEVRPHVEPYEVDGLADAAGAAVARTGREIRNIFRLIGGLFSGNISFDKSIGGPATIVKVSSDVAESSWLRFLLFLGYISVTLAVLNILPIPILDGGHLLFILIEKVKGTPLKEETMGKMQFVGLMLLLLLMFFAFRNDFRNVILG